MTKAPVISASLEHAALDGHSRRCSGSALQSVCSYSAPAFSRSGYSQCRWGLTYHIEEHGMKAQTEQECSRMPSPRLSPSPANTYMYVRWCFNAYVFGIPDYLCNSPVAVCLHNQATSISSKHILVAVLSGLPTSAELFILPYHGTTGENKRTAEDLEQVLFPFCAGRRWEGQQGKDFQCRPEKVTKVQLHSSHWDQNHRLGPG